MRSFDDAMAAARDRRPFGNGTEGASWMDNWCDRCAHDAPYQRGEGGQGCVLLLVALSDKTPAEWTDEQLGSLTDRYRCTEFRPDGGGGGEPEPEPPPVLPGQLDLFTANALDGFESELSQEREVSHAG